MIVTTDIGNILYRDCKAFGIEVYQKGNIPDGEITTERVIIWTKEQSQETYWKKGFVEVNLCVPDVLLTFSPYTTCNLSFCMIIKLRYGILYTISS